MPHFQPSSQARARCIASSRSSSVFFLTILAACPALCFAQSINWHSCSWTTFSEAARERKFVILNIGSSGAHWCHLMDRDTWGDVNVIALIAKSYIAVKVDVSAHPDLANRYSDYDLPATIIINSDGSEIVRKQRFLSPRQMASLLKAVIEDPTPVDSIRPEPAVVYSKSPVLTKDLAATLTDKLHSQYDVPDQGWAFGTMYLDADSVEYASLIAQHDKSQEQWVLDRLATLQTLIDPEWGGVFQSLVVPVTATEDQRAARFVKVQIDGVLDAEGDSWNDPHFEKPLLVQAAAVRIFATAYAQWHHPDFLATARSIQRYVRQFLASPDGAFFAGQDSDVAGAIDSFSYFSGGDSTRRSHGLPHVDTNIYTRDNGVMIEALCQLYKAAGDPSDLEEAKRCASWILSHRSLKGGGFTHAETDSDGPYLCDSLSAGQAFLALYDVSKDRLWLDRAAAADHFIDANFRGQSEAGFVTIKSSSALAFKPHRDRQENAHLACFAHRLALYTGDKSHELVAARAMRYLVTPEIATRGFSAPVLLANSEFNDPISTPRSGATDATRGDSQ